MASNVQQTSLFTANNIKAILQAVPGSNGTYRDIAEKAKDYGTWISPYTISSWVCRGRSELKDNQRDSSYAVFAKSYDELVDRHCDAESNRRREVERALAELEQTCECGQKKALLSGGHRAEACQRCMEMDKHRMVRRR